MPAITARASGQETGAGLRWWRAFPGEAGQLREVRRWIADLLPSCPARDDVTAVACELAANAIRHTASGDHGQFSVLVTRELATVIVAVADEGAEGKPELAGHLLAEGGRGLLIVHALAPDVSVTGDASGRVVAAAVPWPSGN
ncbi:MAG: ATP-binding protein [Nocardiopsaceae bacterium]|nr:ATP-binding protein [Nocardiopsaceae bacterium]